MKGEFRSGKPYEGYGTVIYDNGNIYKGYLVSGKKQGKAEYFYDKTDQNQKGWTIVKPLLLQKREYRPGEDVWKGAIYEGKFVNDEMQLKGQYYYPDGTEKKVK